MPVDTFAGLPIRSDLGQLVADMHPAFFRFPGGCYVEGPKLIHRFDWKASVGLKGDRPGHSSYWDYFSEDGLGLFEYLSFIEQLTNAQGGRVEPVWVINIGQSHDEAVPPDSLGPWIQEALDSLEFAMGEVNTTWGALRASMGHPAPFQINIMSIGNENYGKPVGPN